MRILMVNKFLHPNGGSETYIFELGAYLQQAGHEVEYFGMEHAGRIVGNRSACYTADMDFHTGKLSRLLYPFKILYSLEAKRKIGSLLKDFAPDVVHINNINFQLTPSVIDAVRFYEKRSRRRVKIVATAHDYQWVCPNHMLFIPRQGRPCTRCLGGHYANCIKYRCIHGSAMKSFLGALEGYLYRFWGTYKKVDSVICPSAFLAEKLATYPALRDRLTVLHNFVADGQRDGKAVGETAQMSLPGNYVLYFGRFSKEKGIETLLEACRQLTDIPFVFAGTGPLADRVKEACAPSHMKYMGFQRGADLEKLIRGARFSVYPSEWYENCPFSVMESIKYGTPVLGAAMGGIPELIDVGRTGELFESGNASALAEAINRLWQDKERCKVYRDNCKKTNFDTPKTYGDKLLEIYAG